MSEAQRLGVKVILCLHIEDIKRKRGEIELDICYRNIKKIVNSKEAHCSWDPDKKSIHAAIKSQWPNGFEDINTSVEKIRLEYLLDYPFHEITWKRGTLNSEFHKE